ncbi:MAG: hypothetical protein D6824_05130 [Planctomycetota bacterium]|nr:MAG: hypothetical protein D6824_05130 [Planctomycetota bacterium]
MPIDTGIGDLTEPDPDPTPGSEPPPPSGGGGGSSSTGGGADQTQSAQGGAEEPATTAKAPANLRALRRRAAEAQERVESLAKRLAQTQQALEEAQRQLERQRRQAAIDAALIEAGAIDLETARLLALAEDEEAGGTSDPRVLVEGLRRRKPFLFQQTPSPSAMAPALVDATDAQLLQAAQEAANGDQNALLRFLRLRREQR